MLISLCFRRYNPGDGLVLLRSLHKLQIDSWYTVEARRQGRQASLLIKGQDLVTNDFRGSEGVVTISLRTPLFLGKVPHMPAK